MTNVNPMQIYKKIQIRTKNPKPHEIRDLYGCCSGGVVGELQYLGGGWGRVGGCKGLFWGGERAEAGNDAATQETMTIRGEDPRNT